MDNGTGTERFEMWCRLIPNYIHMDRNGRKRAKREYTRNAIEKEDNMKPVVEYSLMIKDCERVDEPEENNMYTNFDNMEHGAEKQYLYDRLHYIDDAKDLEGKRFYGVANDEPPRTSAELVERIKAGKYVLPEKDKDTQIWYLAGVVDRIQWRDPNKVKDLDGYKAFSEKLGKAKVSARDQIVISKPEDGLKALQEFENYPIQ